MLNVERTEVQLATFLKRTMMVWLHSDIGIIGMGMAGMEIGIGIVGQAKTWKFFGHI